MTFGYGLGHLALNLTAMESSMEKYTKMLGFPSLEVLKAEYSTEASSNWEKVARSVAQSESVASGGQRPGIGSSAWTRNPAGGYCACITAALFPWGVEPGVTAIWSAAAACVSK